MSDFVQYHKREKMGYPALDVDNLAIYSSKAVAAAGDRVWLIAGEGVPRKYFLRATFRVADITSSEIAGFRYRFSGKDGQLFDPMPELTNEPWFPRFLKSQGNFAFGLSRIKDPLEVDGLSAVLYANTFR